MFLIKKIFRYFINKIFLNYKRPLLNRYIYDLAERYFYFYKGECNPDMDTNGEAEVLKNLFKDGGSKCIFDVGANVGGYARRVLALSQDTNLHCFEPNSEAFAELELKFKNIFCNKLALGDEIGNKNLFISPGESSFSSFFLQNEHGLNTEVVEISTIDKYCLSRDINHIDLLKIDTEGSEFLILRGAKRMLESSAIDVIQFEYGHASLSAHVLMSDFVNLFKNHGYVLHKLKLNGIEPVQYTPWLEGCPYANFVAIRQDFDFNKLRGN